VTAPGRKQVFRRARPISDLLGLRDETPPSGRERLLERLMTKGRRCSSRPSLLESRAIFETDLAALPRAARELRTPKPPPVRSTPALLALTAETKKRLLAG
jgi:nicotinate phosphoribosyltransferase